MKTYKKGYRAERELVHLLHSRGWAAMRAPRSGGMGIPLPDVVAIRKGRVVSFEVKSRSLGFSLRKEQFEALLSWKDSSGSETYLAIRPPRGKWLALELDEVPGTLYIGKGLGFRDLMEIIK